MESGCPRFMHNSFRSSAADLRKFITNLEPVVPSQAESEGRVDKASGISGETRWEWEPGGHLFSRILARVLSQMHLIGTIQWDVAYLSESCHDQEAEESD